MTWAFPDVAAVLALHEQQIVRFGGSHGLRDAGLLESAVLRARNKAAYDSDATTATLAASLGWGLIKNHAFIDGNKRIGLVAVTVFLYANGYRLEASTEDQVATVLRVAASEMDEPAWTAWVEAHAKPL